MKLKNKILIISTFLFIILAVISTTALGTYSPKSFGKEITVSGFDDVKTTGGKVVGIIQVVGNIVSIAMLVVIGIKYMLGSAEEKAEYKKTLFPYLVGAILIFAATNLTQAIYNWAIKLK